MKFEVLHISVALKKKSSMYIAFAIKHYFIISFVLNCHKSKLENIFAEIICVHLELYIDCLRITKIRLLPLFVFPNLLFKFTEKA